MNAASPDTLTEALKAIQANPENPQAVIADFEDRAERLASQAVALRQIANGMRSLLGEPARQMPEGNPGTESPTAGPTANGIRPEGMEAVRRIMNDGGVWTARQLLDEMRKRGWESKESKNPIRPTEAAINRLWKVKKEIERVGRGQYRYIGPGAPAPSPPAEFALLPGASEL